MKPSWVSNVFEVSIPTVKRELAKLTELGFIRRLETPWREGQRWGGRTLVDLSWFARESQDTAGPDQNLIPREPVKSGFLIPPYKTFVLRTNL